MSLFVTLEQANEHLRAGIDLDSPLDSPLEGAAADLADKIEEAETHVINFLKVDLDGSPSPLEGYESNVRSAVLLVLSSLYDDREKAEMLSGLGTGDPRNPVVALLYRLRDPALA